MWNCSLLVISIWSPEDTSVYHFTPRRSEDPLLTEPFLQQPIPSYTRPQQSTPYLRKPYRHSISTHFFHYAATNPPPGFSLAPPAPTTHRLRILTHTLPFQTASCMVSCANLFTGGEQDKDTSKFKSRG